MAKIVDVSKADFAERDLRLSLFLVVVLCTNLIKCIICVYEYVHIIQWFVVIILKNVHLNLNNFFFNLFYERQRELVVVVVVDVVVVKEEEIVEETANEEEDLVE